MKILLATLEYVPFRGGVAVYLEQMVQQLKREHEVFVVADRYKNSFMHDQEVSYPLIRHDFYFNFGIFRWLRSYFFLRKLHRQEKFDHLIISHILPMGYVALLLGIPFTIIFHGTDVRNAMENPIRSFFFRMILKKAMFVISNSHYTQTLIERCPISSKHNIIVYPSPKDFTITSYSDYSQGVTKLLSVNRLVPRKGNDKVLEAMYVMSQNGFSNFTYTIVGSGPYKEQLINMINRYRLSDRVVIMENVPDDALSQLYSTHHLFVMPGRLENNVDVEGFGIVYLEAALHKMPSIASHVGGAAEAVLQGETGILINATDEHDLVDALIYAQKNPEIIKKFGEQAYERTTTNFTPTQQWKHYLELLSQDEKI